MSNPYVVHFDNQKPLMCFGLRPPRVTLERSKKSKQVNAILDKVNKGINYLLDVTEKVENDIKRDSSQLEHDFDDLKEHAIKWLPELYDLRQSFKLYESRHDKFPCTSNVQM